MKALSPTELPELVLFIANYLGQRDLVICLRVCRSWNELLRPLVWKSVAVGGIASKEPSHDSLKHNIHYVFNLKVTYPCPLELHTLTFSNLRTLEITHNIVKRPTWRHTNTTQLIALNHSLVYLSVRFLNLGETDEQFWEAVSGLPRLRRLRIEGIEIGSGAMDMFREACSKLEYLRIAGICFPKDEIQPAEWSCSRIQKLEIVQSPNSSHTEELEIIRRCKNLEDLTWRFIPDNNNCDRFVDAIEQGLLPKLKRLDAYFGFEEMSDKNAKRIIYGMQKIVKLFLYSSEFGPLSLRALRRHFSTIVDLNIWSSPSVASEILQELMCSCPLLERFRGGCIQAKDVVGGNAWVCLSMKELEMGFAFEESEQDLQPLIFKRLSSLVLIEKFDFYINLVEVEPHQLDMRLMSGLEQLSHWKNIKILSVWRSKQSMEEIDVRWMIENWPRLSTVRGELNDDSGTSERLREMLRTRDIMEY